MPELSGLLTAMVTPFAQDGRVDEDAAVAMGRHLLANGSDGLVVCGTTGEAATLADDEHLALIKLMVDELGGEATIVGGVGSNDTRHAIHLTAAAAGHGCDALLSVTPYYNKPNARGIRAHFGEVARAAGGTPVLVYNVPSRTATNMGPELLAELAQIDGIDGVKQSNNDELQLIDGMAVFAGNDDACARAADLGAAGTIGVASHLVGNEMKQLMAEPERRASIDAELQEIYTAVFCTNSPAPTKYGLELLGVRAGGVRLPLTECDDAEREIVRRALAAVGALV
ncbi:MAG: 4-hydroxy-tetrahydrodipicolinate synthase [Solirubrobacteraceae bacterium]